MTVDSHGPRVGSYGSWASPITSRVVARGGVGFGQIWFDGRRVFFTEIRPTEKGRNVLVLGDAEGRFTDITPPGFNVRTRVHEYGGGDYLVDGETIYFSNFSDQRVYLQEMGAAPRALTPEAPFRFADYRLDRTRGRIICVREDKRRLVGSEDVNTLVALDLEGDAEGGRVLVQGNEFYASPRISPDGHRLAWLTWNHPDMPWDAAELWLGRFGPDGAIVDPVRIAGGAGESIFQPEWADDGSLYFASDRNGFWNLYRWRHGGGRAPKGSGPDVETLCEKAAEFGLPQWAFGMSTYAVVGPDLIVCTYAERGVWRLGKLDTARRELSPLPAPYTWFSGIRGAAGRAVMLAGSPVEPSSLVSYDVAAGELKVLRRSTDLAFSPEDISVPESIEFPNERGTTAHAFYYRPKNSVFQAPAGEKPPLLVRVHGGPTGFTTSVLSLAIQYWTSRGFAVLDVNYGGSASYGRAYREQLKGNWGIVDVDDCASGALHLAARGDVDRERLAITGGSAGGYTVLSVLTTRDVFGAGASHFGVSDLERLAADARAGVHKFESRYEEGLVAPYPERIDVYRERSPIHHADRLRRPVIFFQGADDRIVLPNQAERMVEVLRTKRLPVAYLAFEGEGHGFRRAETIERVLDAEFYFYSRIFGFALADAIEPVPIENLDLVPR